MTFQAYKSEGELDYNRLWHEDWAGSKSHSGRTSAHARTFWLRAFGLLGQIFFRFC